MATISPTIPASGQSRASEELDTSSALTTIVNEINGNLDAANLADDAVTPAKLDSAGAFEVASLTTTGAVGVTGTLKIGNSTSSTIERGGSGEISYRSTANIHIFRSSSTIGTADGAIYCQSVTQTSGRATKRDVRASPGLEAILKLCGVAYTSKLDDRDSLGLIAEDVADVLPQLVTRPAEGAEPGLNYAGLIAPLVEAIKELASRLETVEAAR